MSQKNFVLPGFTALLLTLGPVAAFPVTLYDGSALPADQGWGRQSSSGGGTVTVGLTTTEFNTVLPDIGPVSRFDNFYYATGETDFVVTFDLQVISSTFNQFDGGLAISVFGNSGSAVTSDRNNNIIIGETAVMWGDLSTSVAVDTSVFHEYSIRYLNGNMDVFIDSPMADIVAGTAIPVLSRAGAVPTPGYTAGTIVFGDNTNDPTVNSNYVMDSVVFDNYAVVPEPGAALLLGVSLAGLALRRRR